MKTYEVLIWNDGYPLTYNCETIADAYGCISTLCSKLVDKADMDLDVIMDRLVAIKRGEDLSYTTHDMVISFIDEDSEE